MARRRKRNLREDDATMLAAVVGTVGGAFTAAASATAVGNKACEDPTSKSGQSSTTKKIALTTIFGVTATAVLFFVVWNIARD